MLNEREALIQQIGALQNATGKTKELTEAKAKLNDINKKLIAEYGPLLKALQAENLSIEKKIELISNLERAEKRLSIDKDLRDRTTDELAAKSKELEGEFGKGAKALATGKISRERYDEEVGKVAAEKAIIDAALSSRTEAVPGAKPTITGAGKPSPEFRFIRARDELANLARERDAYMKRVGTKSEFAKGLSAQAEERFAIEQQAITKQLRGSIAEYIEERYTAEKLAIDAQKEEQIKNVRELVNAKAISEKEGEEQMQRIREAHFLQIYW